MKYLVVCDDLLGYGAAITRGLRAKGHDAELLSWSVRGFVPFLRDRLLPRFKFMAWHDYSFERFQEYFIEHVKNRDFDRFLFLCGDVIVKKTALEWLKMNKKDSRLILWLYDTINRLPGLNESLNLFDDVFTFEDSDLGTIKRYTSAEVRPLYLFCDDNHYKPDESVLKDIDISFVGTWQGPNYAARRAMLTATAELAGKKKWNFLIMGGGGFGSPLKYARDIFYANGFVKYVRAGHLNHHEINKIYQRSKVVLNCPPDNQTDGYPMRTFEVPGSGACLVTQYMSGLERLYRSDEMVFFRDTDELKLRLLNILGDEEKRKMVALAGFNRTSREHILGRRLEMLDS